MKFMPFFILLLMVAACTKKAPSANEMTQDQLIARGKSIYQMNCIACHNDDATVDGSLGPAVAGSTKELIEARVMKAEYPAGYTPKRNTKLMVALPQLEKEIPALAAYLGSLTGAKK